jgi:hypothetical protein
MIWLCAAALLIVLLLLLWLAGARDGLLGVVGAALRFAGWLALLPVVIVLEVRRYVAGIRHNERK